MRKTLIALFLCVVMAGTIEAAVTATARPPEKPVRLETPVLVTPPDKEVFKVDDTTIFEWTEVYGAVAYRLECQGKVFHREGINSVIINAPATSWGPVTFGQTQWPLVVSRWRVTAIASDLSLNSQPSEWRYFIVEH